MNASRGQWRIVARSTEQLARILDVSAAAVTKAEDAGRIAREPDGTWDVLNVVNAWRDSVHRYLQRDPSPWIDPAVELNTTMLVRKSRYAGARVEFQCEGDTAWREVPDPVQRLHRGDPLDPDRSIVESFAVGELNGLVPMAGYWVGVPEMVAPIVAKLAGVSTKKAHAALDCALGFALLCLIAAEEEEHLGPATDEQVRYGRMSMSALTRPDGKQGSERGKANVRRRANRRATGVAGQPLTEARS
jgi:hypothetical protein